MTYRKANHCTRTRSSPKSQTFGPLPCHTRLIITEREREKVDYVDLPYQSHRCRERIPIHSKNTNDSPEKHHHLSPNQKLFRLDVGHNQHPYEDAGDRSYLSYRKIANSAERRGNQSEHSSKQQHGRMAYIEKKVSHYQAIHG